MGNGSHVVSVTGWTSTDRLAGCGKSGWITRGKWVLEFWNRTWCTTQGTVNQDVDLLGYIAHLALDFSSGVLALSNPV
jgi:hypothetical protein